MYKNYLRMWKEISEYFRTELHTYEDLVNLLSENGRFKPLFDSEAEQDDIAIIVKDNIGTGRLYRKIWDMEYEREVELWLVKFKQDYPQHDDYGNLIGYQAKQQYKTVYAKTKDEAISKVQDENDDAKLRTHGYEATTSFDHNLIEHE